MSRDFYNFFLLYVLLTLMFAIVGNINFLFDLREYKDFFSSILTVIDASLGNYSFETIEMGIQNTYLQNIGLVYTILIVLCFNIIVLNLIIAILANTYNIFDGKSNGLYLSKILMSRDEMLYDESYGAFLSAMPPINFVHLPALPFAMVLR
jgi:UDP-N-acetylmuramyl pentapeptide phosphotransferase/UDP-N-acetylglucosamine-1-phosphate transferase